MPNTNDGGTSFRLGCWNPRAKDGKQELGNQRIRLIPATHPIMPSHPQSRPRNHGGGRDPRQLQGQRNRRGDLHGTNHRPAWYSRHGPGPIAQLQQPKRQRLGVV